MRIAYRLVPSILALVLAATALCACSSGSSTGSRTETGDKSVGSNSGPTQKCLAAADVSGALGLEVREFRAGSQNSGPNVVCAYLGTDDKLSVSVTTIVGPSERADEVFGS